MLSDTEGALTETLTRHIGYDLLGPVVHRWLMGLHQHILYFDDGKTKFLYCARAGVRIEALYRIFCEARGAPVTGEMFWLSRMSACKGCFTASEARASALIAHEFQILPMRELIRSVMRNKETILARMDLENEAFAAPGTSFPHWISGKSAEAKAMRSYLRDCSASFQTYVSDLVEGSERVVLIDSGWQGTTQSLLKNSFPDVDWKGLYLGRFLGKTHDPSVADDVIGILFEADQYSPEIPESAFILHHHLIETLLEPNAPSIEEVVGGPLDAVVQEQIEQNLGEVVSETDDALYLHVSAYLNDHGALDEGEILSRYTPAMKGLSRIITMPTRDEALATISKDRSADFGKILHVPVLLPRNHPEFTNPETRIAKALWKPGQIALEEDSVASARAKQLTQMGLNDSASYFDPTSAKDQTVTAASAKLPEQPLVAVITRTINRPVLLRRAAKSVADQTYDGYIWVVVNDGGSREEVERVIAQSGVDLRKVRLVSNEVSQGMEAASNLGIRSVESDYVVIHDDDDSWHPAFLKTTVEYLQSRAGARYGGVVTGTTYVSEEIRGDEVIIHAKRPYNPWLRGIQMTELGAENKFAPIAFIYRRALYDRVGGYNEELPVLGDWYFNLEFLLHSDIRVLPEPLALYHHRERNKGDSTYSNSVVGGISKHEEFHSVVRNSFLRKYSTQTSAALAVIMGAYVNENRQNSGKIFEEVASRGQGPGAASGGGGLVEMADRAYLVAAYNGKLASMKSKMYGRGRKMTALDMDAGWDEILDRFTEIAEPLPTPPSFSESAYLEQNPDVEQAVKTQVVPSAFEHYARHGRLENRKRA